jgi:hypothetical protein
MKESYGEDLANRPGRVAGLPARIWVAGAGPTGSPGASGVGREACLTALVTLFAA